MSILRVGLFSLVTTAVLCLSGCSKLTKVNYDKIEMGMVKPDVEIVLGPADYCDQSFGTYTCIWGDREGQYIEIKFIAGRASVFSYEGLD